MFNNIKAELARYDMSQENLAEFLGISSSTVKNWFNGKATIPSSALIKMSQRWGVSTDYLLGLTPLSNSKN